MNEERTGQEGHGQHNCFGSESGSEAAGNCPMADMCQGLTTNPRIGLLALVPAVVFVCLGVLILIEPRVLTWLLAGIFILLGLAMFAAAFFLCNFSAGSRKGDRS